MIAVDVLTVVPPGGRVCAPVLEALRHQGSVAVEHFIVESDAPAPGEERAARIARARNDAKARGAAPYAMFLDSDVVLPLHGIEKLVYALVFHRHHAAVGIDYQGDAAAARGGHVAMGSVLVYRRVLERIEFRTAPHRCECSCFCEDVRRLGYQIAYLPDLRAEHVSRL